LLLGLLQWHRGRSFNSNDVPLEQDLREPVDQGLKENDVTDTQTLVEDESMHSNDSVSVRNNCSFGFEDQQQGVSDETPRQGIFSLQTLNHAARQHAHSGNECEEKYGLYLLDRWNDASREYCRPSDLSEIKTSLICGSIVMDFMPPPTAPHTFCRATDLIIDFSKVVPASHVKHRPGYMMTEDKSYHNYMPGALQGFCTKTAEFDLENFPRDHLRDIFESFVTPPETTADNVVSKIDLVIEEPTLFVTRERGEHVNCFHSMTDFINAFQTLYVSNLCVNTRTVILDAHPTGPYDMMWNILYSAGGTLLRARDLAAENKVIRFKSAYFVPPGYANPLFHTKSGEVECSRGLELYDAFSIYFLKYANVTDTRGRKTSPKIKITLISRKPYTNYVEHHYMGRRIENEDELVATMKEFPDVDVQAVDYAKLSWPEQLAIDVDTDILVGMHGAGLTHMMFTPRSAAVVELTQEGGNHWKLFKMLAALSGKNYTLWTNRHPENYREDPSGTYMKVHLGEFRELMSQVIADMRIKIRQRAPS